MIIACYIIKFIKSSGIYRCHQTVKQLFTLIIGENGKFKELEEMTSILPVLSLFTRVMMLCSLHNWMMYLNLVVENLLVD